MHLASRLIEKDVSPEIKVQILSKVSLPESEALEGTLGTIADQLKERKPPMPALVIIGQNVVRLSNF